jgi:hypothetical protein
MAKLWYYLDGKTDVSSVSVSVSETIDGLKEKIHAKSVDFECKASDLILTKVRFIMVSTNTDVTNGICWPITPAGR